MESKNELLPRDLSDLNAAIEYNRKNNWPDIPARTLVFLHEYSIVGDLSAASKKIGTNNATGYRILRDPLVRARLDDLQENLSNATVITRAFVELQYLETLEQVNGDVEVPNVTKDGDVVMAKRFSSSGKIQVLRDMSQFAGMKKEQGLDGHGVTINIDLNAAGYSPDITVANSEKVVSEQ